MQHVIALSTMESEYISLIEEVKSGIRLSNICNKLGIEIHSAPMHCDSQSSICIAKNFMYRERKKHNDVKLYFIRDVMATR